MSAAIKSGLPDLPLPNYEYITTTERALEVLPEIKLSEIIEFDTETTSLDTLMARIVLVQIGIIGKAFVFDVRNGKVDAQIFKEILESDRWLKLIQNAVYDYEVMKFNFNIEINRIYDTMLAEQLLFTGLHPKSNLGYLVSKYLHMNMPKDIATSFQDYYQEYKEYQLRYAANDVCVLRSIYALQLPKLRKDGLMQVAKLEFDFIKPLCEMELNGMLLDVVKWRSLLEEKTIERDRIRIQLCSQFEDAIAQQTLFGVSLMNLNSPDQVLDGLHKMGIPAENTNEQELNKYTKYPIVRQLLEYREYEKFISTYGEPMIARIHPVTGRLHTSFKQLVDTGRMSSSDPNLQNIPKQQKYRACFVARKGYKLITCDMNGAELRIIANLSKDKLWVKIFNEDGDLHTISAAYIFKVTEEEVSRDKKLSDDDPTKKRYRDKSKPISFGLAYGLSEFGLARRLGITPDEAKIMIDRYFELYPGIKVFLEAAGQGAVLNGFTTSISGRRRYYALPDPSDPTFKKVRGAIERQGKNHPIQGCLVRGTYVKGIGKIGDCVGKTVRLQTGFNDHTNKATGIYSGSRDVYELKLSNGIKLGITLDHTIPVCTDTGVIDKKVRDIDFGNDLLMVPLNTVVSENPSNISGYKYTKGHWRETYIDYPYPDIMNNKLAFIIGCLIGDGNYSKHNNINFICDEHQLELFKKFNSYIKDVFDYDVAIRSVQKKNDVLWCSQASSVVIRGFLKHIGLDYVINREKSIPKIFFNETIENIGALLDGLFSTDGGITKQSGPNYTTVSKQLANDIHQLLFNIGINSNLKEYENKFGAVYRIQIPKRFIGRFMEVVGSSVENKYDKLTMEMQKFKGKDGSLVPKFIPELIYYTIHESGAFDKLSYNEKAHLHRFKSGSCSFTSWRRFLSYMGICKDRLFLENFINYDFCKPVSINKIGSLDTFDLICEKDPRYFTANGVLVHNSNADTIKQSMVYVVERIKGYDARILLTVHDEIIVEAREDQAEEVARIVEGSICDGFNKYFELVKMKAAADVADYWMKG